jgi:hypothetical protein
MKEKREHEKKETIMRFIYCSGGGKSLLRVKNDMDKRTMIFCFCSHFCDYSMFLIS